MFKAGILTISDKGSRGERIDGSGPIAQKYIEKLSITVDKYEIVPDNIDIISTRLKEWSDREGLDLIITNGGTGLAERDITPEATLAVIEKQVPGIPEAMRTGSAKHTPTSMLSRAVAGSRGKCLIINLPGSPSGVKDCMEILSPVLIHALETIHGLVGDHNHSVDV
jgi:molybdenum cofactor synthesis domain-containing protein